MKTAHSFIAGIGVILCSFVLGSAYGDSPWGEAWGGGVKKHDLTQRTASGGACLETDDLGADVDEIRFAPGEVLVDQISIDDGRAIAFVGASAGTVLKPDPQSYGQFGGALNVTGGRMIVRDLTFSGFYAETAGGAISLWEATGDSSIQNCRFANCRSSMSSGAGGAVYASATIGSDVTLSIVGCSFEECQAANGGAITTERIYPYKEKAIGLSIKDSAFDRTDASYSGGAIWNEGNLRVESSSFTDCSAGSQGGAICAGSTDVAFAGLSLELRSSVTFDGNLTTDDWSTGGAIALVSSGIGLTGTGAAFCANVSDCGGGALFACAGTAVRLTTSIFSNNTVTASNEENLGYGGALFVAEGSRCALTNLTVRGSNKGAVYVYDATAELVNCVVVGNSGTDVCSVATTPAKAFSMTRTAYGSLDCTGVSVTTNGCLPNSTVAIYRGSTLCLRETEPYNPVAAEGVIQAARDFDGVAYGSKDFGYSMGAYEGATTTCIEGQSYTFLYDGAKHTNTFTSACVTITPDWEYATAEEGPWSSERPLFSDVGVHTTWARAIYKIGGVESFRLTTSATVTITRRHVDLLSASAQKVYDNRPLTSNDVWVVGSGDNGLAEGDNLKFNCTGSQAVAGTSANTYTYSIENARGEDVTSDYDVSASDGTLTVLAAPMPPPDHDPDPKGPNYPPSAGPFDGPNLPPGQNPPLPADKSGKTITLSDYDVVTVYDGEPHTFDWNGLVEKLEGLKRDAFYGNDYTIEYSLTGVKGTWKSTPFSFVNVRETPASFWYRVSVPNFTNYIHAVGVTITQRVVQVTSGDGSWKYDGQSHSNATVSVTDGSFAPGESITATDFATVRDVGTSDNAFKVNWTAADPSNYSFTTRTGLLEITPKDEGPSFGPVADVFYYNADEKEPKPGVTDVIDGKVVVLVEGTDFDYFWFDNVNASETAKLVARFKGNYSGAITNDFTILPRSVTLTSGTQTWSYDAKPHTNETITATPYAAPNLGFVPGEGVSTSRFTVVTEVTNGVANAFSWNWLPNTLAQNYTVDVAPGSLTVLAVPMPAPDHGPDPVGPDYPPAAGPFDGPNLPPGQNPPLPIAEGGETIKLSDYDVVTVYDGQPHTFDEAALIAKLDEFERAGKFYGNGYTLDYSLTGQTGAWTSGPFSFVDVNETPTSFWYRVSVPNFTNYIHAVGVTITQRVVTVRYPTAVKTYDGTVDYLGVLTTNAVFGTHDMVSGEAFFCQAWGKFADPSAGTPALVLTNVAFTALNEATLFSNYKIYFGDSGKTLFDPDVCVGPGPVFFGSEDDAWPKAASEQPTASGRIDRALMTVEAIGALRGYDGISTNIGVIVNAGVEVGGWYRVLYAADLAIPESDYTYNGPVLTKTARMAKATSAAVAADGTSGRPADDSERWSERIPHFKNVATNAYEGAYAQYGFNGTNGTYIVWYRVLSQNYAEISGFAAVTVTPRQVEFMFPQVVKKFDGSDELPESILETNLLRTTGHNMVGSEKFTAYGWGKFTKPSVGSGESYVSLVRILTTADDGAEDRNYRKIYCVLGEDGEIKPIGVLGVNADGETTLNGVVISEDAPVGSSAAITPADENPDDDPYPPPKKEDQPDGKTPKPAPEPTAALSAYDTTNVYDAVGHTLDTNALWNAILGPLSKYVITDEDREKVRFHYSIDGMSWSEAPLLFTNAVVTSFWYRVCVPNYETNCHAVAVTVLKRAVHLKANLQSMVYSDLSTLTPGFDVPAAWDENPTNAPSDNLLAGDGVKVVHLTFDRPYLDYRAGETNRGVIVTNLSVAATNATKSVFVITNASGDVTHNYELKSFLPGDLWVEENLALFKATLKWMYVSDSFVAQLTIENTNRTARFKYEPGSMRFCFADRENTPYGAMKLWDWKTYSAVQTTHALGRAFTLADPDPADPIGGWRPNTPVVFGPTTASISLSDGFSYIGKSPYVWVQDRQAPLGDYEGYLVWISDGQEFSIPLVAKSEIVRGENTPTFTLASADAEDDTPRFEESVVSENLYRYAVVSNVVRVLGTQGGSLTFKKVSGSLPTGLSVKYDAAETALAVVGVPTATDAKKGTKTFESVYQVIESRKVSGKTVKVNGETVRFVYTVIDPVIAGGEGGAALNGFFATTRTYSDLMVIDEANEMLVGTLTLTVPRTGKASAKFSCAAGKLSFSAGSWSGVSSDGILGLKLTCTSKGYRNAVLTGSADATGMTSLSIEGVGDSALRVVSGTIWSKTHSASAYQGTYTVALPVDEVVEDPLDYAAKGAVALSLKMTSASQANAGRMTWTGTLPDGTAISGTAVLTQDDDGGSVSLPIFVSTKKDSFGAVVSIAGDFCCSATLVKPHWRHTENATALPDAGFMIRYGLRGGLYGAAKAYSSVVMVDVKDGEQVTQQDVKVSVTAAGVAKGTFSMLDGAGKKTSVKLCGVILTDWSGQVGPTLLGSWSYAAKLGYTDNKGAARYLTVRRGGEALTAEAE